ncbi:MULTISPECIES: deoxyribodipyrimidine photo-lyase [unclassified Salinivibrio]|uniref:deoxyribodipyrimidine photo-lyase n=1 Tax=unclassified Salinivibrio TaxID=2636825 RepID=UPI00128D25EF|nr:MULTISPECIES: deoxyribodipyrimidine photo-lyase [unclassified Salinivibrio]MPS31123.1 deoxyribodipyrimidine photo-lyase [Salinivibrio sp. VYel7]MPX92524.1 deoxyribodipyrimidine photo-lyase [Salinivibrio sp. VYel9]MPX96978.1 deoxyribodipyrimidine photo-lyase [Salinivibrio sp. VYel6]MPX98756.1 deoxyribodipyrimidine photo-lyase [Salinivibrio sp. VYel4]MPY01543.1 deoxyribodipyrimidine photo-lyase [Salinivibrio sp. VYel5]
MHLVWFRRDLRGLDNRALSAASEASDPVVGIFIETPEQWASHHLAPKQAGLIKARLEALREELRAQNIPLVVERAADFSQSAEKVADYAHRIGATAVFANKEYELNESKRDEQARVALADKGIAWYAYDDRNLFAPDTIKSGKGEPYKVFTPFKKACLRALDGMDASPRQKPPKREINSAVDAIFSQLKPIHFDYPTEDVSDWASDEKGILAHMRRYCREQVADYKRQRDFPAVDATSQLSPYLAIGALSPRQCLARLQEEHADWREPDTGAATWLSELIWRDFYQEVSAQNPAISKKYSFLAWGESVVWDNDLTLFEAWKAGKTGFPIVDAAMHQLNQTGWMHNRLRMIVASFLTKDLLIDWRWGEDYFMSKLIDGDFASNNGGWQWSASVGTDAQPYFRIFNPTTQGERFDSDGRFIRRWLPALKQVPGKHIHQPWQWADHYAQTLDYPRPVVDHATQRKKALAIFEAAKNQPQEQTP